MFVVSFVSPFSCEQALRFINIPYGRLVTICIERVRRNGSYSGKKKEVANKVNLHFTLFFCLLITFIADMKVEELYPGCCVFGTGKGELTSAIYNVTIFLYALSYYNNTFLQFTSTK